MVGVAIAGAAVVGAGASLYAGNQQANAIEGASAIEAQLARESIAEQRRQYDQTRTDFAPYRDTGQNALREYAALYGITRGGVTADGSPQPEFLDERYQTGTRQVEIPWRGRQQNYGHEAGGPYYGGEAGGRAPSYRTEPVYGTRQVANPAYDPNQGRAPRDIMQEARSRFLETPGYQFRFEEGVRALDRSASAGGRLAGGAHERELIRYGQGIGSAEFENYSNRLAGLAGMGQGATSSTATLNQQSSNQISNALLTSGGRQAQLGADAGAARASGYVGAANAATSGVSNYLLWDALKTQPAAG